VTNNLSFITLDSSASCRGERLCLNKLSFFSQKIISSILKNVILENNSSSKKNLQKLTSECIRLHQIFIATLFAIFPTIRDDRTLKKFLIHSLLFDEIKGKVHSTDHLFKIFGKRACVSFENAQRN